MSSAPLTPTSPNPTSPAERDNPMQWGEKLWERQLMEGEKSLEVEQPKIVDTKPEATPVPDAFIKWIGVQEPFVAKEASSESQGLRGSGTFAVLNAAESASEAVVSTFKKVSENVGLVKDAVVEIKDALTGTGEWTIHTPQAQTVEKPLTQEEQAQLTEFKIAKQWDQEVVAGQKVARQQTAQAEDERAGLAGMSLEKRAQKSGIQSGLRTIEVLQNASTRAFTFLKEKWTAQRESMKEQKPFEVVQGRFNKLGNLLKLNAQEGNSQVANQIMGAG